jgi:hypothetical protein
MEHLAYNTDNTAKESQVSFPAPSTLLATQEDEGKPLAARTATQVG